MSCIREQVRLLVAPCTPPRALTLDGATAARSMLLALGSVVALSWSGVPPPRSAVTSQGQLEPGRWPRSNWDARLFATGSMPSKEATSQAESRVASRRTEPNMMADEDNAAQALVIKGAALVVIYLILAQILPTPPERI